MQTVVRDLDALESFARALARHLKTGSTVVFRGSLGAGKTTLVRALLRALHGSDDAVSSPTFVFRQSYQGHPLIEHLDLYRIETPDELADLGLEDAFGPDRITFVEWPENGPGLLPSDTIDITIAGSGNGPRTISIGGGVTV